MANQNIFQQRVTPEKPRVLRDERVFVYVPTASNEAEGIASFNSRDFGVNAGKVSLIWPMQMDVEQLADPTVGPSRIKVLDDEFEKTANPATVTNPVTGTSYTSRTAEVQLNRKNRRAFERPDLVMLDNEKDFEVTQDENGYNKYTLQRNNPLEQPSLVQMNSDDFVRPGQIVEVSWPYAHNPSVGTKRTKGYGLVKVNPSGYLKFNEGLLDVDVPKVRDMTIVKPTYGADASTGFENYSDYVDGNGYAKVDTQGHPLLAITKEAIGLSKVANKAFSEYTYPEFGQSMKSHFEGNFNKKLDKTTWNTLFSDWQPPTSSKATPQKWFQSLEAEDESIWDTIRSIRLFLGYFDDLSHLTSLYPANNTTFGCLAYLLDHRSYFAVRTSNVDKMFATDAEAKAYTPPKNYTVYVTGSKATGNRFQWTSISKKYTQIGINDAVYVDYFLANDEDLAPFVEANKATLVVGDRIGIRETNQIFIWDGTTANLSSETVHYEWYDTAVANLSFGDFMETQSTVYRADGVAAAGHSGKWAQSDHVHPTDETRLAKDIFKNTVIEITSQDLVDSSHDFKFPLWEEDDQGNYVPIRTVNIPYIQKGLAIQNYQGLKAFMDQNWEGREDEAEIAYRNFLRNGTESYWRGTSAEFTEEQSTIASNSLIVVEDGEDFTIDSFLAKGSLDAQGITIDATSTERFVIVNSNEAANMVGKPIVIKPIYESVTGTKRYRLEAQELEQGIVAIVDGHLASSPIPEDMIVTGSSDGLPTVGPYVPNLLVTSKSSESTILSPNQLVVRSSSTNINEVVSLDSGLTTGAPIVSNGNHGIKVNTFTNEKSVLVAGENGALDEAGVTADNMLVTKADMTTTILPAGQLLVSLSGNQVETFDTGSGNNQLVVSNGTGGVKLSTMAANKLLYTAGVGQPAVFPMTAADAGKYVGVDATGAPTLLAPSPHPATLPVTMYTSNPGANANGLVVAKLTADPGSYSQGVLYLW